MHFTLYFESLKYTSIAASVVLVNLEVFFVALFLFFMYREKFRSKVFWASAPLFWERYSSL